MNKYIYNLNVFYNQDATSYYLLGAIMTDGCVVIDKSKKKVSLVSNDKDWLEMICNIICPGRPIYPHHNAWSLYFHSTELANWLISKGCTPAKSLTLKWPEVPEQYLPDFIRGCIDGDGSLGIYNSIRKTRNNIIETKIKSYLCSSSYEFIQVFSNTLTAHNINNSFYLKKQSPTSMIEGRILHRSGPHYKVEMANRATKQLVNWIYYPGHKLSMPRKNKIAQAIINY